MFSNSLGQGLIEHLRAVSNLAKDMAQKLGLSVELVEDCRLTGLWHDIGKAIPSFQAFIQTQIGQGLLIMDDDLVVYNGDDPLHQEISWAFVGGKLYNESVLQAIY